MLADLLRLMRPSDWVKNVFILPALVFSLPTLPEDGRGEILADWLGDTALVVIAFSATCISSSLKEISGKGERAMDTSAMPASVMNRLP